MQAREQQRDAGAERERGTTNSKGREHSRFKQQCSLLPGEIGWRAFPVRSADPDEPHANGSGN